MTFDLIAFKSEISIRRNTFTGKRLQTNPCYSVFNKSLLANSRRVFLVVVLEQIQLRVRVVEKWSKAIVDDYFIAVCRKSFSLYLKQKNDVQ